MIKNYRKPLYSLNIECAVLGSIIINKRSLEKVIDILKPEIFYKYENKIIFKYILKIYNEYKKIDFLTLIYELKKDKKLKTIGGEIYISYIINTNTTFYNLEEYVNILIKKFILRRIIKLSIDVINKAYEKNIETFFLLNYIQNNIEEISLKYIKNKIQSIEDLLPKTIKKFKKNYIKTGYKKLDKIILGLQKSDLIILASRPGMGKTSLSLSLIKKLIKQNISIGLFSLEMSYYQIITRLITFETNLTYTKLKKFDLNKKENKKFKKKIKKIQKFPLYIDDSSFLSILDLKNKCRKLIYKKK